jgi:hypothetical protein
MPKLFSKAREPDLQNVLCEVDEQTDIKIRDQSVLVALLASRKPAADLEHGIDLSEG